MRFLKANQIFPLCDKPVTDGVLVIEQNGTIVEVLHDSSQIDPGNVELFSGFITPGFVNAHCHLELSHLKNQIEKFSGLPEFAQRVVAKREIPKEKITEAMQMADEEMCKEGIVAVGDISNRKDSFETKINSKLFYHTFIELIGFNPARAERVFQDGLGLLSDLQSLGLKGSLAPHAPYSVSIELMQKIARHCKENNFPGSIHNQECEDEDLFFKYKTGKFLDLYSNLGIDISYFLPTKKNSLTSYLKHLEGIEKLLLIHNTFTTQEDVIFAKNFIPELFLCFCVKANLFIENKFPDIKTLLIRDVKFTVGTDSLAGNDSLSILSELKTIHRLFPEIELNTLFSWACSNGAIALNIDKTFGSFQKGKKPGVLHITFPSENFEKSEVKRII